jgi:hypothetical protein
LLSRNARRRNKPLLPRGNERRRQKRKGDHDMKRQKPRLVRRERRRPCSARLGRRRRLTIRSHKK